MKLNQAPSVAKLDLSLRWVLKVDINLLNQHCKSADWLADLLTYWGSQGAQDTRVLKQLRHSWHPSTWVTWRAIEHMVTQALKVLKVLEEHVRNKALKELGNLGTWRTFGHSKHLGTWGTRALEGQFEGTRGHFEGTWRELEHSKGTWALEHSGNWVLIHSRHSRHFI